MLNDLTLLIRVLHDTYDLFDYLDTCPKLQKKFKEYFYTCFDEKYSKLGFNTHKSLVLDNKTPIRDILGWSDRGIDLDVYCQAYDMLGIEIEEEEEEDDD